MLQVTCPHPQGLQRQKKLRKAPKSASGRDRNTIKVFNSSHIPPCFVLSFAIKAPFCSEERKKIKSVWKFKFRSLFFKHFQPKSFLAAGFPDNGGCSASQLICDPLNVCLKVKMLKCPTCKNQFRGVSSGAASFLLEEIPSSDPLQSFLTPKVLSY